MNNSKKFLNKKNGLFYLVAEDEVIAEVSIFVCDYFVLRSEGVYTVHIALCGSVSSIPESEDHSQHRMNLKSSHFKGFFCLGADDEVITDMNGQPLPNNARVKLHIILKFRFFLHFSQLIPIVSRDARLNVQRTR